MSDTNNDGGAAVSGADLLTSGAGGGNDGGAAAAAAAEAQAASLALDGIDDDELKTWAGNKKFPDLRTALESHRNLEKLLGGDKLPVPRDENDAEGRERFFKALGRPDSPAGYDLGSLQGADPKFAEVAATWLHQAGVGKAEAGKFAAAWNDYVTKQTADVQAAFDAQSRADFGQLRTEWGPEYDANIEHARRASRTLGLQQDEAKAIELEIGTKRFMALMAQIGRGIGEDSFIDGGGSRSFQMTPEQARARIDALRKDAEWQSRWLNGGAEEKAEWDRLNRVASQKAAA